MFIKEKRISLLSYWTSRYVLTLLVGLGVVFLISVLWVRHTTLEYRLEIMEFMADETIHRISNNDTLGGQEKGIPNFLEERDRANFRSMDPIMFIADANGEVLTSNRPYMPLPEMNFSALVNRDKDIMKTKIDDQTYYVVKREIVSNEKVIGYVLVVERKAMLVQVNQEFGQIALIIVTLGLLGWCAIYFLSKRLSRPIKKVAEAAKLVQEGNYNFELPSSIKEKEVYELVTSFKEMAIRLEQLEKTRTELLAGVTHELKTPVTSISGLLQAVQDGVVTGVEAEEFIQMALVETTKMKTMVGDLLGFNAFAVHAVPVKMTIMDVNDCIQKIVSRWSATRETIKITMHKLEKDVEVQVDIVRIQQIITNILTNAAQAMKNNGTLTISLREKGDFVHVNLQDTGAGILETDQPFIFERFYRGENKKYDVRGLGLGLPLSKMMAQSIGGDLQLISSNEHGTCFEILLKKVEFDI